MLNNCETDDDLTNEKSLKHENTKEQSESVTVPEQYIYEHDSTNASVDAHNNALYTLSKANKAQIKAMDIIVGDISDDLKKQMKNKSQMIQQRQWVCIC